ncbi:hypothetical protein ACFYYH_22515 [Streptomyces sp. NPDC002018]|uniref:hypothetical protein n=1 Tax=Streptomyces sp. NPDC002018 TaxID=3364629 RepID=UPI0036914E07
MASIKGRFEYPDDLTPGKSKDGGLHQNLYDSHGRLADHGTFFPDDENEADLPTDPPSAFVHVYVTDEYRSVSRSKERDELVEVISELLSHAIYHAVATAKPHVKRWWKNQALPAIKSRWNRPARTRGTDSQPATAEASTVIEATVVNSSQEVVSALDGHRASMSSTEARVRLLLALAAKAFSEEQVRIVSSAHIEDDDGFVELARAVAELTPQQVANVVKTLEANPSFLDDETSAELGKILGGNERIKETLRLTDPGKQPRSPEQR